MSRLPVQIDGSCNGLQHYAALSRDLEGGTSVNLMPCDRPQACNLFSHCQTVHLQLVLWLGHLSECCMLAIARLCICSLCCGLITCLDAACKCEEQPCASCICLASHCSCGMWSLLILRSKDCLYLQAEIPWQPGIAHPVHEMCSAWWAFLTERSPDRPFTPCAGCVFCCGPRGATHC